MSSEAILDEFLSSQSSGVHRSDRRLAKLVREAYPIGVPAMIMKSSTDRLGAASGYSFHLGTPDDLLRLVASWLFTEAGDDQQVLLHLVKRLWKRHGREDVALAALILANLDHARIGTSPWEVLAASIGRKEPAEAILLSIEEILRAGHPPPSEDTVRAWCEGRRVDSHLALVSTFVSFKRSGKIDGNLRKIVSGVEIPSGDSLLGRIKERIEGNHP